MGKGAGRGKFKGKPTGRRHFSTPEEMSKFHLFFFSLSLPFLCFRFDVNYCDKMNETYLTMKTYKDLNIKYCKTFNIKFVHTMKD